MRRRPVELDQGELRLRWLTQAEAEARAREWGIGFPSWAIMGFQDRDTGDLVVRYRQNTWRKIDTIIHEFIHWMAWWMPRPIRRWIDYLLDGVWYE